MNDQEYIKAGVGLADGWLERDEFIIGPSPLMDYYAPEGIAQPILDALAAQLVRQVEAAECRVTFYGAYVSIERDDSEHDYVGVAGQRTLNTIKAIVDSGVLT